MTPAKLASLSKVKRGLKTRFRHKKGGPGVSHVQLSFICRRVNISFFVEWTYPILRFTDFLLVAHSAKFKMNLLPFASDKREQEK